MDCMSEWIPVDDSPYGTKVLVWVYLPKNPTASCYAVGERPYIQEDESEDYGEFRLTVGCWWVNGRYYRKGEETGYVTHWMPLPPPPEDT